MWKFKGLILIDCSVLKGLVKMLCDSLARSTVTLRFLGFIQTSLSLCDSPLRISYCTADKMHDKVFAYIAQSQQNETLECHAYLCTKRKVVSVSVAPLPNSISPRGWLCE